MTCREIRSDKGDLIGFACSRGQRESKATCSVCGKRPHTKLCDFPLTGSKAGRTCDRRVCDECAVPQGHANGDTVDYCSAHDKVAKAREVSHA